MGISNKVLKLTLVADTDTVDLWHHQVSINLMSFSLTSSTIAPFRAAVAHEEPKRESFHEQKFPGPLNTEGAQTRHRNPPN